MLAAGVEMAVVSKRLGHSGIRITSDTYTHLLEGVAARLPRLPPHSSREGRRGEARARDQR